MKRTVLIAVGVLAGLLPTVWAATGGPDAYGLVFIDSNESDGPPHVLLDIDDEGQDLGLGDEDTAALDLPFEVSWYGSKESTAYVGDNGTLFFSGGQGASSATCPPGGSWSGIAAYWDDLSGGTVRAATLGQEPYRLVVVDWQDVSAGSSSGTGQVQVWLQEARNEVVIVHEDLDFGDTAYDGGAGAVVGVQGSSTAGLEWSCSGGLSDQTSAWFGLPSARVGNSVARLGTSTSYVVGSADYEYAGETLAGGDLNGDGQDELVVGSPQKDSVYVFYGGTSLGARTTADAPVSVTGASGGTLGSSMALGDFNGDGSLDLALGEEDNDDAATDAGAAWLYYNTSLTGALSTSDADLGLLGPSGSTKANAGSALAAPGDIDGDGYEDLLIGASGHDGASTNAGAVFLFAGGPLTGTFNLSTMPTLCGSNPADRVGEALSGGDADGDGLADMLVGVRLNDDSDTDAGKGYLLLGGSWTGANDLDTSAEATFEGLNALDYLGSSVLLGDLDGDGYGDLVFGATKEDTGATNAGLVAVFVDGSAWSGAYDVDDATVVITGDSSNQLVGHSLDAFDVDQDGVDDLIVGGTGAWSSSGGAWIFAGLPTGSADVGDADYALRGVSGGASGQALVGLQDHDGTGSGDVAVGAWLASALSLTNNGFVALWSHAESWEDADGDGLIARSARGPDCDDEDADAYPGADEDTALDSGGFADDRDCDGWVDGVVQLRHDPTWWESDLDDELGGVTTEVFDFEKAQQSSALDTFYQPEGVEFTASGSVTAATSVYGAAPNGQLGARVAGTTLLIELDRDADGLAFQLLDPEQTVSIELFDASGDSLPPTGGKLRLDVEGDDVPGGRFVGLTFSEGVRTLRLVSQTTDGVGLDDLRIAWAEDSDRDRDGYTPAQGDCDDTDADVNPSATEVLTDGIDNDCDGVIDGGGATAYAVDTDWESAITITVERIDFETLTLGAAVTTQYDGRGVEFDGTLQVVADIDGAGVNDTQGAQATSQTVTLSFEELQPAVAFELFDGDGTFTLTGYASGVALYANTLTLSESGTHSFHGYTYGYGVDTLEITGPANDVWGLDDVLLSVLGLDDADGDGYTEADGDCDDSDPTANPGATETWYDGVDSDCDGNSDYDADADGWDSPADCDDTDAGVNPGATESWYDGVDQDCDGGSDYDADEDGWDSDAWSGDDCDDSDPSVNPGVSEVFYDGVDDNCDPLDDWDADGDGWGMGGAGSQGSGDCDDTDSGVHPTANESWYDGVDQDCDGSSDYDADSDGYDHDGYGGADCDDTRAQVHPGASDTWYDGVDGDCDGASDYDADGDGYDHDGYGGTDCDDTDASIHPGATESDPEDGVDEDCDGTDEWDDDGDGYRGAEDGGTDCDDTDPTVHPGATEKCYDGTDQDCDGGANEYDCDEDGYDSDQYGGTDCQDGDPAVHPGAREYLYDGVDSDCDGTDDYDGDGDGYQVTWYGGTDCDDEDPAVNPGATEVWYDGVDQDCDTNSDWDADGDGEDSDQYGGADCDDGDPDIPGVEVPYDGIDQDCDGQDSVDVDGDGYASASTGGADCDDADGSVFPGAPETWYDGVDQDCDPSNEYDADHDGQDHEAYGGTDCDDEDPHAMLGATERWYDGLDWDCLGGDDFDQDGDGYAIALWGGDDCDDLDPTVHPDQVDLCGGGDVDCDDQVDEDCEDTGLDTDDSADTADSAEDSPTDDSATPDDSESPSDTEEQNHIEDPPLDEHDDEGCGGCSGAPSGAWSLAWLVAVALGRRRL